MMRAFFVVAALVAAGGCQTEQSLIAQGDVPQGRLSIDHGPPPPGYIKIIGGTVPNWRPEDMHGMRPGPKSPLVWEPLGPRPITGEGWSGGEDASGRIVGIAPHPTDPDIAYIASASGGVWKTTDGGALWTPMTDELSNLNHGAIAIDPNNPETVYIGTGEYTTGSKGDGIFRSTDGGVNWEQLADAIAVGPRFSGLVVDPFNSDIIHGSSKAGYVRSVDGGASWQKQFAVAISGMALNPIDPSIVYICRENSGVYRSTDGGDTFTKLIDGLPSSGVNRIVISLCASNPDVLYTAMAAGSGLQGLYKTTDGGDSWFQLEGTPDFPQPQAWYDMYVAVDPTDEDIVFCGGVSPIYANAGIIRSMDGGETWMEVSEGIFGGQTHPDHQCIAFGPGGWIWEGNDGGVWKTYNRGKSWINCNSTLTVTQNYTVGASVHDEALVLGGTQDVGTVQRVEDSLEWPQLIGGDGGFLAYDYDDPTIKYTTYVYLSVQRWLDGEVDWISGPWDDDPRNFIAPLVMDPNDPQTLLGGTNRIWRTLNAPTAAEWTVISSSLVSGGGTINAIAVANGDSGIIYSGSSNGRVWVTFDAGTWVNRTSGLPSGQISDIVLNPEDAAIAYVSFYNTSGPRILRTDDYGQNWIDVTGDLPVGAGATALAVDWRFPTAGLYIGTGAGVWASIDGGFTWIKDENDLPNVNIGDLQIDTKRDTIVAGTYGRGAWRADLPTFVPCPADVTGEGVVDVLDLLAVLAAWDETGDVPEDITGDGVVDVLDLLEVLAAWGPC